MNVLDDDLLVDDLLRTRLVRVGHAIETSPAFVPRAIAASEVSSRGWIRRAVIAVVAGSVLGGTMLFGRPPANDPVVGVIPRGITVDQIEQIALNQQSARNSIGRTSLVTVDGIDALLMSYVGKPEQGGQNEEKRVALGIELRTSILNTPHVHPYVNGRTMVRWRSPGGQNYLAILAKENVNLERAVDRLVAFSIRSSPSKPSTGVRVVASWTDRFERPGAYLTVVGTPPRNVSSQASAIPGRYLARVDNVTGRPSAGRFRYGDFVVTVEPLGLTARNLRPIRRSELRTLAKQIDRRIAAKVPSDSWVQLDNGFDVGFSSQWRCVRSPSDVSCALFMLNRLVDDTWVRVSFRDTEAVRVDGREIPGQNVDAPSAMGPSITVFILPEGIAVAEFRTGPPGSPYAYELPRPEF